MRLTPTATACEAGNRRLGDALDIIAQHLAVALRAALAEALATLSASRHVDRVVVFFVLCSVDGLVRKKSFDYFELIPVDSG